LGKPVALLELTTNEMKLVGSEQEMEWHGAEHPAEETEALPF